MSARTSPVSQKHSGSTTLRWWGSRFVARWVQRPELAAVDRVLSRLLLLASLWSFLALFWLSGRLLRELLLAEPDVYTALKTVLRPPTISSASSVAPRNGSPAA